MDKTRLPQAALRIFVIGLTVFGTSTSHLGVAQEETRVATRPSFQFGKNNWPLRTNAANAEAKGETVQQPGIFRGGLVQQLRSITSSVLGDDGSAEETDLTPTDIDENVISGEETDGIASPSVKDMIDAPAYSDEEMDEADLDEPIADAPEVISPNSKNTNAKNTNAPSAGLSASEDAAESIEEQTSPTMPLPLVPGQSRWRNQQTAPLMDPPALSRGATSSAAKPTKNSAPTARSSAPAVGTGTRSTDPANNKPTINNRTTTSRSSTAKAPATPQGNSIGSSKVPTPPTSIPKPPTALKSTSPESISSTPNKGTDNATADSKKATATQTATQPSKTNSSRKSATANKSNTETTLPKASVTELEEGRLKLSDQATLPSADLSASSPEAGPLVSKKLPPSKSKPPKTNVPTATTTSTEATQENATTAEHTPSAEDSDPKSASDSAPEIVASGSPSDPKMSPSTSPQLSLDVDSTAKPSDSDIPEATSASQTKLIDMEIPSVLVRLSGPSDIPVGRKGDYELITKNTGIIPLNGVIVRMDIPKGVSAEPAAEAKDSVQLEKMEDGSVALLWQVSELTPDQSQKLPVKLVASEARNFAIAMEWTVLPQNGQMLVNVQQPALQIGLEGPAEVNYGAPQMYRLKVSNPGTAPAENVVLNMTAEPYGSNSSPLGTIPAGSHRVVEVELTFQQRGKLKIKAEAVATDLKTSSEIDVLVRQAMLEATITGVESEYVGATGSYEFKLSNKGDTAAENVVAQVELPEGVKLNQLPSGARLSGRNLLWEINQLAAGQDLNLNFDTEYLAAGEKLFQVTCRGSAGASVVTQTKTLVEAVADLKLTLSDPPSPSPIGEEVVYELEIVNRGKQSANNVKIIAQFSEGIEPSSAIGSEHKIVPGQVLFEPIQSIAAGGSVKLQVRALASQAGVHRFRVEVQTDDEEIHHVLEESTRYTQTAARPTGTKLR